MLPVSQRTSRAPAEADDPGASCQTTNPLPGVKRFTISWRFSRRARRLPAAMRPGSEPPLWRRQDEQLTALSKGPARGNSGFTNPSSSCHPSFETAFAADKQHRRRAEPRELLAATASKVERRPAGACQPLVETR